MLVTTAVRRQKQKDQKFKVISHYIEGLRLAYAMGHLRNHLRKKIMKLSFSRNGWNWSISSYKTTKRQILQLCGIYIKSICAHICTHTYTHKT